MRAAFSFLAVVMLGCSPADFTPSADTCTDADCGETDNNVDTDTDMEEDTDADTDIEDVEPPTFVKYRFQTTWPHANSIEVQCGGTTVWEVTDFTSPNGQYEARLDVEPGTPCVGVVSDADGGSMPGGEVYMCDVVHSGWEAEVGDGPKQVGAITAEQCRPGCMDDTAGNYDPEANLATEDCEYIAGCMDPRASNYDPRATEDDGTCAFDGFAVMEIEYTTDSWPGETTIVVECDGFEIYREDALYQSFKTFTATMVIDAGYTCKVLVSDSYGDGAPGGAFRVCGEEVFSWPPPFGDYTSYTVEVGETFILGCSGCTNITSPNYDPGAYVDDGSCQ